MRLTIRAEKGYEVVCFLADVGQEEDFKAAEEKALKIGATKMIVTDLKKEFVVRQEDSCDLGQQSDKLTLIG